MRLSRGRIAVLGMVVCLGSTGLAGCGSDMDIGILEGAIEAGDQITRVAIRHCATELCMISSDGEATEKRVVMDYCPSGLFWPTHKSWTLIAVEPYDGDIWYWNIRNTSSNQCLKWVSNDYYLESDCSSGSSNSFLFTTTGYASEIRPAAQMGYRLRPYTNLVENVIQSSSNITWDLYQ